MNINEEIDYIVQRNATDFLSDCARNTHRCNASFSLSSAHLRIITLLRLFLPPLLLKCLNLLYTLLIPHTALPLSPLLEHTPYPRGLSDLGHTLEQIPDVLCAAMALLQHEVHIPDIAFLGEGVDKALKDGAAAFGIAVGALELESGELLCQVAVLR